MGVRTRGWRSLPQNDLQAFNIHTDHRGQDQRSEDGGVLLQATHKPFSYTHCLWGSGREVGGLCCKPIHKPDHRGQDERLEVFAANRSTSLTIGARTRGWRMAMSCCQKIQKPFYPHTDYGCQDERLEDSGLPLQNSSVLLYVHRDRTDY